MASKKACLIINPRAGENVAKINDILAVLSAAGWKTELALKEYGGHAMTLATRAADDDYDMIIAYGGDGTLNQVVNGIMNGKGQHSIFGVLPGGTANVWASESGVPPDPIRAALSLVDSEVRKVDIGHVEIEGLTFLDATTGEQNGQQDKKSKKASKKANRKVQAPSDAKHHFLLMAGLGIDAAVMGSVSKPLKYHIGPLAVGVAAAQKLPEQHPFPVEVRSKGTDGEESVLWKGEALQVVVGNTRKYGDLVEMTPDAYIDDGLLDVCVITAGNPISTMQQVTSLLLRRRPDNTTAEYFRGAHLHISVPASIDLQLDGSTGKLKDYLSKSDRKALEQAQDATRVMVNYRFDAMPRALRAAIPRSYDNTLFKKDEQKDEGQTVAQNLEAGQADQHMEEHAEEHNNKHGEEVHGELLDKINALLDHGRKVTIVGMSPNKVKKHTYHIIAGTTVKQATGEVRPCAVLVDENATVLDHDGRRVTPDAFHELKEGDTIAVDGSKSKRGVIHPEHVVI
ncbi:MAG: diacylglycerol kinase family lipid kinase [Ktedonobacteraceae bacterium]|nr:diacylglycerol kinase family lipid kinase [Ktedonobacteraceae bacterium]